MKIAIVAPTEIPSRRANTIQVMKMAQSIREQGHVVQLAVPRYGGADRPAELDWEALKHHYGLKHPFPIIGLPARSSWRRYDFSLRAVRWARSWNTDLLYTRLPQAAALASLLGMQTVLEIHDYPQGALGPWLFRAFLSGKGARRMVAITRALAIDLARDFDAPKAAPFTIIAPDGVDLERYTELPAPEDARRELKDDPAIPAFGDRGLPVERFTAGYTGHLYPGRGTNLLIDLAKGIPEISFLIVGGQPGDLQRAQKLADSQGLDNLRFTGFVPNAELPRYQAACDVLLMPYQRKVSASSGGDIARYLSPMKLFEYLACERVILSSDLPVFREVLNPENSVLLPADELNAWVDALKNLQTDPAMRAQLAAQARRDADQYTWNKRAERIFSDLEN